MKLYAILLALCATACGAVVDSDDPKRAVEALGFTDVVVADKSIVTHGFDGCGRDDAASFKVQGKNPRGVLTFVTVCCGFPCKGCTVRH
jgi:hypothetical protein